MSNYSFINRATTNPTEPWAEECWAKWISNSFPQTVTHWFPQEPTANITVLISVIRLEQLLNQSRIIIICVLRAC